MDYLIDSITESYKNKPFSLDDVDILPLQSVPAWNKGKKLDDTHKESVSKSLKGHIITEQTKRKISASLKGRRINPNIISVYTPIGIFESMKSAAEAFNVSQPTIKTWATKKKNGFYFI
jgi:hypothetical protein